jgi:hypothetical protein
MNGLYTEETARKQNVSDMILVYDLHIIDKHKQVNDAGDLNNP